MPIPRRTPPVVVHPSPEFVAPESITPSSPYRGSPVTGVVTAGELLTLLLTAQKALDEGRLAYRECRTLLYDIVHELESDPSVDMSAPLFATASKFLKENE